MENSVAYFYNSALRWSFGFENPNKAAVIFACLLPLLFIGWNFAWKWETSWRFKIFGAVVVAAIIIGNALCLFKTYSRGGVLAAIAGVAYFLYCTGRQRQSCTWRQFFYSARSSTTCFLFGLLVVLFAWVGLGERSLDPVTVSDASVGHRLFLWKSALQMAVENPAGFGTGKSGAAYMQWYQPIESTSEYRTMVNSYLTLVVEQGWLVFASVILLTVLFGFWCVPCEPGAPGFDVALGLRASILTFLVAGFFSTTMEELILWIIPGICAAILSAWSAASRVTLPWPKAAAAVQVTILLLLPLYIGGLIVSNSDPLTRKFARDADGCNISEISLKQPSLAAKTWTVMPDTMILGDSYGKLLRQLVLETGVILKIKDTENPFVSADRLLIAGRGVEHAPTPSKSFTILVEPDAVSTTEAQAWLSSTPRLLVLTPAIDEDRRARFWREYVETSHPPNVTLKALTGVGLRVDWAWEEVIAFVKKS